MTGLPKPLLPKVISGYCSKSGIVKKSLNFPWNTCLLNLILWTQRCQFWKNCRRHFPKNFTRFLLKIRESNQKTNFSKESRQKSSFGHVDCGSQLHQMSFTRIEIKDHFKIRFSSKVFPSTRRKEMWELYTVFFVQSQILVKTWKLFHSKSSTGDDANLFDNPAIFVWCCENVSHNVRNRQKNFHFPQKVQLSITVPLDM